MRTRNISLIHTCKPKNLDLCLTQNLLVRAPWPDWGDVLLRSGNRGPSDPAPTEKALLLSMAPLMLLTPPTRAPLLNYFTFFTIQRHKYLRAAVNKQGREGAITAAVLDSESTGERMPAKWFNLLLSGPLPLISSARNDRRQEMDLFLRILMLLCRSD